MKITNRLIENSVSKAFETLILEGADEMLGKQALEALRKSYLKCMDGGDKFHTPYLDVDEENQVIKLDNGMTIQYDIIDSDNDEIDFQLLDNEDEVISLEDSTREDIKVELLDLLVGEMGDDDEIAGQEDNDYDEMSDERSFGPDKYKMDDVEGTMINESIDATKLVSEIKTSKDAMALGQKLMQDKEFRNKLIKHFWDTKGPGKVINQAKSLVGNLMKGKIFTAIKTTVVDQVQMSQHDTKVLFIMFKENPKLMFKVIKVLLAEVFSYGAATPLVAKDFVELGVAYVCAEAKSMGQEVDLNADDLMANGQEGESGEVTIGKPSSNGNEVEDAEYEVINEGKSNAIVEQILTSCPEIEEKIIGMLNYDRDERDLNDTIREVAYYLEQHVGLCRRYTQVLAISKELVARCMKKATRYMGPLIKTEDEQEAADAHREESMIRAYRLREFIEHFKEVSPGSLRYYAIDVFGKRDSIKRIVISLAVIYKEYKYNTYINAWDSRGKCTLSQEDLKVGRLILKLLKPELKEEYKKYKEEQKQKEKESHAESPVETSEVESINEVKSNFFNMLNRINSSTYILSEQEELFNDDIKKIAREKFEECKDDSEIVGDIEFDEKDGGWAYGWFDAVCEKDGWSFKFEGAGPFVRCGEEEDDWELDDNVGIEEFNEISFVSPSGEMGQIGSFRK